MSVELWVITVGSFLASFVNGAFATGGVYILLASSTAVLPLTAAVPLQSAFAFSSLMSRIGFFWQHIDWPIVAAFVAGSFIGVYFAAGIFSSLHEGTIGLLVGSLLLVLIWLPTVNWRVPFKHPFFPVGIVHSFLGTLFGVGAILQPIMLRTKLVKAQITGTLAACLLSADVLKITGYVSYGFDYRDYLPHIVLATIAGFCGTWAGKRVNHRVSEKTFRLVFRWLITLVAIRLLYRGWILSS
jgi:uncharacterized protein